MLVQLQGREVWYLQLNEAVSRRLVELMQERGMTQYQLYMKSGVPKSLNSYLQSMYCFL